MDVVRVRQKPDEPDAYERLEEYEGLAHLFEVAEAEEEEDEDEDGDDEEEE
jgi:hypothetical protein